MDKVELIGDVLVNEDERLQNRINQLHDRLETTLRQSLRIAASAGEIGATHDATTTANLLISFTTGRWHQFAKSGFKRFPMEFWADKSLTLTRLDKS